MYKITIFDSPQGKDAFLASGEYVEGRGDTLPEFKIRLKNMVPDINATFDVVTIETVLSKYKTREALAGVRPGSSTVYAAILMEAASRAPSEFTKAFRERAKVPAVLPSDLEASGSWSSGDTGLQELPALDAGVMTPEEIKEVEAKWMGSKGTIESAPTQAESAPESLESIVERAVARIGQTLTVEKEGVIKTGRVMSVYIDRKNKKRDPKPYYRVQVPDSKKVFLVRVTSPQVTFC